MKLTEDMMKHSIKYQLTKEEIKLQLLMFAKKASLDKMVDNDELSIENFNHIMDGATYLTLSATACLFARHYKENPELFPDNPDTTDTSKEEKPDAFMRAEDFTLTNEEREDVTKRFLKSSGVSKMFTEGKISSDELAEITISANKLFGDVGCAIYSHYSKVHGAPDFFEFSRESHKKPYSLYEFALTDIELEELCTQCLLKSGFVDLGTKYNISTDIIKGISKDIKDTILDGNLIIASRFIGEKEMSNLVDNTLGLKKMLNMVNEACGDTFGLSKEGANEQSVSQGEKYPKE